MLQLLGEKLTVSQNPMKSAVSPVKAQISLARHRHTYEPRCEKTGLRGFRPGPTQTRLYCHRRRLVACNFVSREERDCSIRVAKTMALISFEVTAKLICVFVFAYAKSRFSHDAAHIMINVL